MTQVEVTYHDGEIEKLTFAQLKNAEIFVKSISKNPDVAKVQRIA